MKYIIVLLTLTTQVAFSQTAENLVITCNACHGERGISTNDLWPNLAGQKKGYLIKQLKDFRSGARKDPVMNPLSLGLSDEDIEKISEYFSSIK